MSRRILGLILVGFLIFSVSYAQVGKFKDVPSNHWAAEAVKYMTALGIITGIKPDTFGGDLYVTRYQVAVLLYKLIQALQSGKIVLPAADVSELKDLVSQLQDELQLIGANVEDLMSALQDLDSRVSDLEAAITEKVGVEDVENMINEALSDVNARLDDLEAKVESIEKVEVTPEQIEAVVGERLEQLVESKLEDLTNRVTDLEGFVTDLDSRLADVEAALVDKPSLDEVQAMIEEKMSEIQVPDVEDLTNRVTDLEGFVTDLDSRLADVEAALVDKPSLDEVQAMIEEKMSEIQVPDVEDLTNRVTDLEDRVSAVETRLDDVDSAISDIMSSVDDLNANLVDLSGKVDEVLALKDQLDQLILRIESIQGIEVPAELDEIKSFIMDLDSRLSELSTAIDDVNTVVSELQSQVDDVNAKVDEINTNIENINSTLDALSTSVDDLYLLNDGVSTRLDETVDRLSTLDERVTNLEKAVEKNFTVTLGFDTSINIATRKPENSSTVAVTLNNLNLGFGTTKLNLQATNKASEVDLTVTLSGSMDKVAYSVYGVLTGDIGPLGIDLSMPVSKDIVGFAGASYNNAKFSVYGGVELSMLKNTVIDITVGVPDISALGTGELKDTVSLKLGASFKLSDKVTLTGYATNLENGAAAAKLAVVYTPVSNANLSVGVYLYGLGNLISGNFDAIDKYLTFSTGVSF